MKVRLTSPTFDASAQTVVHASFSDVGLAGIQLIVNVTDQEIIYNFADSAKGGTLSTDTLTLEYDTTSMSDTDELMVLVEDGTTTQAVSGTVTANLSATDNTVLDNIDTSNAAIKTAVETIDNAISGSEMQVDVVAALPAGTNAIGKLAANSGVDIGDVDVLTLPSLDGTNIEGDVADDAADSGNPVKIGGVANSGNPGLRSSGDRVHLWMSQRGAAVVDGGLAHDAVDANNPIKIGGKASSSSPSDVASGDRVDAYFDLKGRQAVFTDVALPAGTNAIGKLAANSGVDIGDVDVTSISAGTNTIGNVGLIGRTSGGMSIFRSIDIDETEEDVKTSAGQVFSITAFNRTAAPVYLKFYNATAANVTVGTTTPVLTFVVPGNADSDGAGFVWNNDIGFAFGTAISVAATTGIADNDTGAPGANDCIVNVGYA